MICPYNGFVEMDCEECAAYLPVKNPDHKNITYRGTVTVCAIAYNGGTPGSQIILRNEKDDLEAACHIQNC